jgi:peptidoglycan/xylan/chitin deacetylase (PgdA/CDA1 family)
MICVGGMAMAESQTGGIVTFTVDNISQDFFEKRWPEFTKRNLLGTLYVQTEPIGVAEWDMGWDELRIINQSGWEIGAHSYSHEIPLSKATDDELALELGAPAARIFREIGVYPLTFATPFGDYDERTLENVRLYYEAHFAAWGNHGFNDVASTDRYRINREEIFWHQSSDAICAAMEQAAEREQWLVLMLHGVTDGEPTEYTIGHQTFVEILNCAAKLRDEGKIKVIRAVDALNILPK